MLHLFVCPTINIPCQQPLPTCLMCLEAACAIVCCITSRCACSVSIQADNTSFLCRLPPRKPLLPRRRLQQRRQHPRPQSPLPPRRRHLLRRQQVPRRLPPKRQPQRLRQPKLLLLLPQQLERCPHPWPPLLLRGVWESHLPQMVFIQHHLT